MTAPFFYALRRVLAVIFILTAIMSPVLFVSAQSEDGTLSPVTVVTPLPGKVADDSLIVIVGPQANPENTKTLVKVFPKEGGDVPLVEKEVSPETNWIADINTQKLTDGAANVVVETCSDTACAKKEIPVVVANDLSDTALKSAAPPYEKGAAVTIIPSNWLSVLSITRPSDEKLSYASTGDPLDIPIGTYDARLDIIDSPIKRIDFHGLRAKIDTVLAQVETIPLLTSDMHAVGIGDYALEEIERLHLGAEADSQEVSLGKATGQALFTCDSWDTEKRACSHAWTRIENSEKPIPITERNTTLGWARSVTAEKEGPNGRVTLTPSNTEAKVILYNEKGDAVVNSSAPFTIPKGIYSAEIIFFNSPLSSVYLRDMHVNGDATLLTVNSEIATQTTVPAPNDMTWRRIISLYPGVSFSDGRGVFRLRTDPDAILQCDNWDETGMTCPSTFNEIPSVNYPGELAEGDAVRGNGLSDAPSAVRFAPSLIEIPLLHGKSAIGFGMEPKRLRLEKFLRDVAANDTPQITAFLTKGDSDPVDYPLRAQLTYPDGSVHDLPDDAIQHLETGKVLLAPPRPRSFRPGLYTLTVRAAGDASEANSSPALGESRTFYWGLIAINTKKSTYRPGETAEFEIVVLDRNSFGVTGARVRLGVQSPTGKSIILSSGEGTVHETTTPGIYLASLLVSEEGTYNLEARAVAPTIDSTIQTTFDVQKKIDYDIVRWTATKIDPARQPNEVGLTITPLENHATPLSIREIVPAEFDVQVGTTINQYDANGNSTAQFVPDPRVTIVTRGDAKIITWNDLPAQPGVGIELHYTYSVPDRKPWLYFLGPVQIRPLEEARDANSTTLATPFFQEARTWMIAADANPTSVLFFRRTGGFTGAFEPSPNDANCGTGCGISSYLAGVQQIYGLSDIAGSASDTNAGATGTSVGVKKYFSAVSYPLAPQTITTSGTWTAGIACALSSTTDNNSAPAFTIYRWIASTDSNGERIVPYFNGAVCATAARIKSGTKAGAVSSVTFQRGDKIVVEVLGAINSTAPPPTSRTLTYTFGNSSVNTDGNVALPSGVTLRFAGDLNTEIVSPANNYSPGINTAFDVNARGSCKKAAPTLNSGFSCGDTNMTLQYCTYSGGQCGQFTDMNTDSSSPLYIDIGGSFQRDSLMDASDVNYFVFSVKGTATGTYTIRSRIDSGWSVDTNYSNLTNTDVNVIIAGSDYSFAVMLPSSGCTQGKGNISGGTVCERGWIESSDTAGGADETSVQPEGQVDSGPPYSPFLVFDNQSTSSSDFNILLDTNEALPSSVALKVTQTPGGWAATCTGDPVSSCVLLSTTPASVGTAHYSTGVQDLNIFVYGDFVNASAGAIDLNVGASGTAP